jgi:hypothetical protein
MMALLIFTRNPDLIGPVRRRPADPCGGYRRHQHHCCCSTSSRSPDVRRDLSGLSGVGCDATARALSAMTSMAIEAAAVFAAVNFS